MERYVCKVCGEQLEQKIGDFYVCKYCGSRWKVEKEVTRLPVLDNAWQALRNGDFDVAEELFEDVINTDNANHEAYWGRALAAASIIYVNDLNENKKVPTCNNISEQVFADGTFVKKAIELAPAEIADSYKQQAEYIDKVRIEWLNKASKEPAYDVFISYKDSDKEHGIERTQDSYDAQELYTELVRRGYNVFYSRVSLRDKLSEQYEPYIYNAIKTAKVMIVLAEKPEYITATWVKNEWSRFRNRIECGEKDSRSLVFVYKNLDLSDIPAALRSRQCLNMAEMTFLPSLISHIEKVIESTRKNQGVEKIAITGGKIAKKSTEISQNQITVREIGSTVAQTSLNDAQTLSLVMSYLETNDFTHAQKCLDGLLLSDSENGEFLLAKLLLEKRCSTIKALMTELSNFDKSDFSFIESIISRLPKKEAKKLLAAMYERANEVNDILAARIYEVILPFACTNRDKFILNAVDNCIENGKLKSFKQLLLTLDKNDTDKYIELNLRFVEHNKPKDDEYAACIECLQAALDVDEGNIVALDALLEFGICKNDKSSEELYALFERLLSYSSDVNKVVAEWLPKLQALYNDNNCATCILCFRQMLKYYQADLSNLDEAILNFADLLLSEYNFADANVLYDIVLAHSTQSPRAYLGIALSKIGAPDINKLGINCSKITDLPEFSKYLSLLDTKQRKQILANIQRQQTDLSQRTIADEQCASERYSDYVHARKNSFFAARKGIIIRSIIFSVIWLVFCGAINLLSNRELWTWWLILIAVIVGLLFAFIISYRTARRIVLFPWLLGDVAIVYAFRGISPSDLRAIVYGALGVYFFFTFIGICMPTDADRIFGTRKRIHLTEEIANRYIDQDGLMEVKWSAISKLDIDGNVKEICNDLFENCCDLRKVYFCGTADNWNKIKFKSGKSNPLRWGAALYVKGKRVTNLKLSDVSDYAFYGCGSLTDVCLTEAVKHIGKESFYGCRSLENISIDCSSLTIGEDAFAYCEKLAQVSFGANVKRIGSRMFYGCSSLLTIRYDGKQKDWVKLPKKADWNIGTGGYKVYCTDGVLDKSGNCIEQYESGYFLK